MTRGTFLRNLIGLYGLASLPVEMVKQYKKVYLLQCFVRGFQYYSGPTIINEINKSGLLDLVREPDNSYDKNAIALYFNQQKIGFIPMESNEIICALLDTSLLKLQAEVTHIEKGALDWEKIHVAVYAMKEVDGSFNQEVVQPYTVIETPYYYTLKSSLDTYTRVYYEEDDQVMDSEDFYQTMVEHSSTDDVYTLLHTSFPNPEEMDEAINASRLVVCKGSLPKDVLLETIEARIDNEPISIENIFGESGYIVANVNAIAVLPDKIDRFEKIIDKTGNCFYEVVFKS